MKLFAFGIRRRDPASYLADVVMVTRDWPLGSEPMRTPRGPEVGDVQRFDAMPCGCTYEPGAGWDPCPTHPASCQAIVGWRDQARTEPVERCGVPVELGARCCADHAPRCEDCGRETETDTDNRCPACAGEARRNRASLSQN